MSDTEKLQIKVLSWAVTVVGTTLISIIAFVGYQFDARLFRIEEYIMEKSVATQNTSHPYALAKSKTD